MKLPLCAALLGGLAATLSAVGEPPAKAGKTAAAKAAAAKKLLTQHRCQLRMMWWVSPAENVELGVQQDDEVVSVGLAQMQVNGTLDYHGEPLVQIMKKTDTGVLDKKGKPVIAWTPYATIPLRPEDTDICAILFDDGKGGARTKLFDFRPTVFPYGSLQVVNLSKKPLTCGLDSRTMTIAPGWISPGPAPTSPSARTTGSPRPSAWSWSSATDVSDSTSPVTTTPCGSSITGAPLVWSSMLTQERQDGLREVVGP